MIQLLNPNDMMLNCLLNFLIEPCFARAMRRYPTAADFVNLDSTGQAHAFVVLVNVFSGCVGNFLSQHTKTVDAVLDVTGRHIVTLYALYGVIELVNTSCEALIDQSNQVRRFLFDIGIYGYGNSSLRQVFGFFNCHST